MTEEDMARIHHISTMLANEVAQKKPDYHFIEMLLKDLHEVYQRNYF